MEEGGVNTIKPGIPFTQYLRPNGGQRSGWIVRSAEIEGLARACIKQGAVFESEVLLTGDISLTSRRTNDSDHQYAIELVPNGPEVLKAVDRLVIATHAIIELTTSQ